MFIGKIKSIFFIISKYKTLKTFIQRILNQFYISTYMASLFPSSDMCP